MEHVEGFGFDFGAQFGVSVSLDGDTALIGAQWDNDNGDQSGSAYIFIRSGTTWTQETKLIPSDPTEQKYFGESVSLDGTTALIGAYGDNQGMGSSYVFTKETSPPNPPTITGPAHRKNKHKTYIQFHSDRS